MPPQFSKLVFFEGDASERPQPRLRVTESDVPAVMISASQTRRRMERAIGVLEEMSACAQAGQEPSKLLCVAAHKAASDLHTIVESMGALERALRCRERRIVDRRELRR